ATECEPMKWATDSCGCSVARIRGLENSFSPLILGLAPQALCFRLLRRLRPHFVQSYSEHIKQSDVGLYPCDVLPETRTEGGNVVNPRHLLLTITVVLLCAGNIPAQHSSPPNALVQNKHIITPEDVLTIRELSDVKLSPDGKRIAFVVNEPNDPNKPREPRASNIWIVPTDGREPPRPLIAGLKSADTPSWSPDGHSLAFLSDAQIYLLRDGESRASKLSDVPGGVEEYH